MSGAYLMTHAGEGYRILMRDGQSIASDSEYDLARAARLVLQFRERCDFVGKVCHIGAGLCLIVRMLGDSIELKHVVLDIEPATRQFCPTWATFILGDWRDTIAQSAPYAAIIYDLGEVAPLAELQKYSPIVIFEDT